MVPRHPESRERFKQQLEKGITSTPILLQNPGGKGRGEVTSVRISSRQKDGAGKTPWSQLCPPNKTCCNGGGREQVGRNLKEGGGWKITLGKERSPAYPGTHHNKGEKERDQLGDLVKKGGSVSAPTTARGE